jgi:hypothetical protein
MCVEKRGRTRSSGGRSDRIGAGNSGRAGHLLARPLSASTGWEPSRDRSIKNHQPRTLDSSCRRISVTLLDFCNTRQRHCISAGCLHWNKVLLPFGVTLAALRSSPRRARSRFSFAIGNLATWVLTLLGNRDSTSVLLSFTTTPHRLGRNTPACQLWAPPRKSNLLAPAWQQPPGRKKRTRTRGARRRPLDLARITTSAPGRQLPRPSPVARSP